MLFLDAKAGDKIHIGTGNIVFEEVGRNYVTLSINLGQSMTTTVNVQQRFSLGNITFVITKIERKFGNKYAKIGIQAPNSVTILRDKVYQRQFQ